MENIKKTKAKNLEIWLAWLATNHSHTQRVWLIIAKKNSSIESISMSEAIAGALCYGWVDSRKKGIDKDTYMVYFTPRRPNSQWSPANKTLVEKLIKDGLMATPGLEAINLAKDKGHY